MNKFFTIIILFFSANSTANYLNHPDSNDLVEELVNIHNFEKSYVEEIVFNAKKKQKILDDMSSPAEFTLTWDRYKAIFIENKRIQNGKILPNTTLIYDIELVSSDYPFLTYNSTNIIKTKDSLFVYKLSKGPNNGLPITTETYATYNYRAYYNVRKSYYRNAKRKNS